MRRSLVLLVIAGCESSAPPQPCASFTQFGADPGHSGAVCVTGQPLDRTLEVIVVDPFAAQEAADAEGDLLVHYQAPLVAGDDVYLMVKRGTFTPCDPSVGCDLYHRNSQIWGEQAHRWQDGQLVPSWSFLTDWKPEPGTRFEPMFQPVIAGDFMYIPGLGGSVHKLDRTTGAPLARISPFGGTLDPDTYVAGGLSAGPDGSVTYTAIKLDHDLPWVTDATGWLVKVLPDDTFVTRGTQELAVGAPAATDLCRGVFPNTLPRPWPPPDDENGIVLPEERPCLSQRPALNLVPGVGPDGTVYLVTRAQGTQFRGYLVAVNPDLTTRWAKSLAHIFDDGCGVLIPLDGSVENPFACSPDARAGVDPRTNELPSAQVVDDSTSSPVVLPDGGVLWGATTGYNGFRGHLVKLDASGEVVATHDFGWDVTPAVWRHDGTYSIILKNNTYSRTTDGTLTGPFFLEQLDADLQVEWRYQLTNTRSCIRGEAGELLCVEDHPNGFEWCINAPVVDAEGTVYATGEDGNAYAIGQGGVERGRLFLEMAIGAAYTPLALDHTGRVYTLNDGKLKVLGR
jgi:outer membrane protein assembly factor BamB